MRGRVSAVPIRQPIPVIRLRRAEHREPIRNPFRRANKPRARFVPQECQPLTAEKEASLVIGHVKAMSGA